jgi:hypothetical protein
MTLTAHYGTTYFPQPSSGAEYSITVPTGKTWRLFGFTATLTVRARGTDERIVSWVLTDTTGTSVLRMPLSTGIPIPTADTDWDFTGWIGAASAITNPQNAVAWVSIPPIDLPLPAGWGFKTYTRNILQPGGGQPGDQWKNLAVVVDEV